MKRARAAELVLLALLGVAVVVFLMRGLGAGLPVVGVPGDTFLLRFACIFKLGFLATGAGMALRNAQRFGAGNPIRPAWLFLGLGLAAMLVGQTVLALSQFSPSASTPFPSLADVFFLLSYPLFVAALVSFGRAYEAAGFPVGTRAARWTTGGAVATVGLVAAVVVLRPIVLKAVPPLTKFLNVAYPVLDLAVLVPTVLLFRASLPLRGGQVWKAWAAVLAGFFFMSAGDVLFAYFQVLNVTGVDPLVHVTFLLSYGFLAWGVVRQSRLLAS